MTDAFAPARWTGGKRSVQANPKPDAPAPAPAPVEAPAPEPVPAPETGTEIQIDEPAQAFTRPVDATDAARALAAERGLQLTTIVGTGKDGRVTQQDVEGFAATGR